MNLGLLPGNSHLEWMREVEDKIKPLFDETKLLEYKHFETGEELIDLEHESDKLEELIYDLGEYLIVAKSAGSILAVKNIFENKINPIGCVFMGVPILWAREKGFEVDKWIKNYSMPTLFIQQTNDPYMPAEKLREWLLENNVSNYTLVEVPGDNHHYEDLELLKSGIEKFIA